MRVRSKGISKGDSAAAIARTALELFSSRGFAKTTTRDIANAVNMPSGSMYTYIQSKDELLRSIFLDGIKIFRAEIKLLTGIKCSPSEYLRGLIGIHIKILAENPELSNIMPQQWRSLTSDGLEIAKAWQNEYIKLFVDVIEEGIRAGEFRAVENPRILALTIIGALNSTPEWICLQDLGVTEISGLLADVLLHGTAINCC